MGFPVGYSELLFPKLVLHFLSLFSLFTKLISTLTSFLGLHPHDPACPEPDAPMPQFQSVSAMLIRQILPPVVTFRDLAEPPESCAVCLSEFEEDDEIRGLPNCRHVFHRGCLDRWMGYDQRTCPLCRSSFVPEEMQGVFNDILWAASGVPHFHSVPF